MPSGRDCSPLNPFHQHLTPNQTTRKRLSKLPIYVTNEDITTFNNKITPLSTYFHINSPTAKKHAPEARTYFLQTIKKYPRTLSHIEKANPRNVYITSKRSETYGSTHSKDNDVAIRKPAFRDDKETRKQIQEDSKMVGPLIQRYATEYPDLFPDEKSKLDAYERAKKDYQSGLLQMPRKKTHNTPRKLKNRDIRTGAETIHHELTHVEQDPEYCQACHKIPYPIRPSELEARDAERENLKGYKKVQPKTEYLPNILDYNLDTDNDGVPDSSDCKPLDPNKQHLYTSYPYKKKLNSKYSLFDLGRMMEYPRPAGSQFEKQYVKKYIDTIHGIEKDPYGNRYIRIGDSRTAFTSHTDTVHEQGDSRFVTNDKFMTPLLKTGKYTYEDDQGFFYAPSDVKKIPSKKQDVYLQGKWLKKKDNDILGADDTTGNWLMLNMIHDKKPGLYLFYRDEEIGRLGSKYSLKYRPNIYKNIDRMISFDRHGYSSVITKQSGEETASPSFAKTLAKKLGGDFKPDPTGSYTDSYTFRGKIPECTNISVGMHDCHSMFEKQNIKFAGHLLDRVRKTDFESLPTKRKPEKEEIIWYPKKTKQTYITTTQSYDKQYTKSYPSYERVDYDPYTDDYYDWYEKELNRKKYGSWWRKKQNQSKGSK